MVKNKHSDKPLLKLIDYGLTTSYLDKNGKHIDNKKKESFIGNFLFASVSTL